MSKFCTSCGTPLPEGAKFCASCGTPAAVAPAPAPAPIPEPVPAPAPAPIPEPIPAPAPEPAPAPIPEPAPAPIPEPAPAPVQEPAPVQQPVYQPAPAPVQEPVYQPAPAPVQEPVYTAPQTAPTYSYQPQQPVYQQPAPAKKKSNAGLIVVIIAIIAALAVAAIFVPWDDIFDSGSGGGSSSSDKGDGGSNSGSTVKQGVQAIFDVNYGLKLNKLGDIAPDAYWDYVEEETGMSLKDIKNELEDDFETAQESIEEQLGSNFKFSFEITDETELDEDELAYVAEAIESTYGIKAKNVQAAVCLEIDITLEGSEDSVDTSTSDAYMVQISGKWYAVDIYLDDEDTEVEFAADMFVQMAE